MKKFLTSYMLSIPLLVVGIVSFTEVSNPDFLASADTNLGSHTLAGYFLIIVGAVCLIAGIISIAFRIVSTGLTGKR